MCLFTAVAGTCFFAMKSRMFPPLFKIKKQTVRQPANPPCFLNDESVDDLTAVFGPAGKQLYLLEIRNAGDLRAFAGLDEKTVIMERTLSGSTGQKKKSYTFRQEINGVPVAGSSITLQTDADGRITFANCNISLRAKKLEAAKTDLPDKLLKNFTSDPRIRHVSKAESVIYDPELMQKTGDAVPAWQIDVTHVTHQTKRYFICQKTGKTVFSYPLTTSNTNTTF